MRRLGLIFGFLAVCLFNVYAVDSVTNESWQSKKSEFYVANGYKVDDLTSKIGMGFGSFLNKYSWSMEHFKDHLYVGTWNLSTTIIPSITRGGAEVWRLENEQTKEWKKVLDMSKGKFAEQMHIGFREMAVYKDKIYVGSMAITQNAGLWESSDGINWKLLKTFNATSIRGMAEYKGKFYFTTTSELGSVGGASGELWSYDGETFEKVYSETATGGIGTLLVFNDNLYFAGWSSIMQDIRSILPGEDLPLQRLYKYDGNEVKPVLELKDGHWLMTIDKFNGYMYIGTAGLFGGGGLQPFQLIRSKTPDDVDSWETIVGENGVYEAGFGYRDNFYCWNLEEYNGKFYLGTFKMAGSSQLWVSEDGVTWTKIFEPKSRMVYGIRELQSDNDGLYIGTAYNLLSPCMGNKCGAQVFKLTEVQ
jgi:hypothetical protein